MKIPEEIAEKEIDDKLQNMLDQLQLSERIKTDDIKNIIYHEKDLKGPMKIINAFTDYAKGKKQFDLVAETVSLAWNYLPHESLGNLSPYQKYQQYYYNEQVLSSGNKKTGKNDVKAPKYNSNKTSIYQLFEDLLPEKIFVKRV